jgi:site-specific recombinase XerD
MKEAQARFEQYLKRRFGQSSTLKHYRSDLNIFIALIGSNKAPEAVTAEEIDTFVDHQIAAGLSPATINRRLSSLHTFFEYLVSEKPGADWPNPVIKRRHRLKMGSHLPRDMSDSDIARLFAVISNARDQAMFGLMVGAGLRVGEVTTLHLDSLEEPVEPGGLTKLRVRGKGNKERVVWLTTSLRETLQTWLKVRAAVDSDYLFLNRRGQPISVAGVQYCLKQYSREVGLSLSCHRLRHTFGRRLAENGLPVDSLAKLLGHSQLQTTQRYIDGADPTVRIDFTSAMTRLEICLSRDPETPPDPPQPEPLPQRRRASPTDLVKLRQRLVSLPPWLGEAGDIYLSWHWPTWRSQTAYHLGLTLIGVIRRLWTWLKVHRQVKGWESFRRADLEAWLQARSQDGVSQVTIRNDLARLRSLLKFLELHDYPLDLGLFRVQAPKPEAQSLPRYLSEGDYRRLEKVVLQATGVETYAASFDRAFFLTLAHTGVRISELLDLRLSDLNLAASYATIRGSKPGRDRVVYLTPVLSQALRRYLHQRADLPADDHVFLLHGRLPTARTIQRRLAAYGQQAGVPVSPHRLRHTLATRLLNQGMPIQSLRKLLGHENLNTTQLYARIYDETLYGQFKEAMAHLEAIAVDDWPSVERSEPALVAR